MRWADHASELAAGRSVIESGFGLFPAMVGSEMVAALYLAQPEGLSALDAAVFGTAIAHAVLASDSAEPGPPCRRRARPSKAGCRC